MSKALQEVQAGQTEQSLYESFVELAAALQGMGEANLELNEQLSELNEQQKRVDDLLVELADLEQRIGHSEGNSARLDTELGQTLVRLTSLQGTVNHEFERYNTLKNKVKSLDEQVKSYEIKLGLREPEAMRQASLFAMSSMSRTAAFGAPMMSAESNERALDSRFSDPLVEAALQDVAESRATLDTLNQTLTVQQHAVAAQVAVVAQYNQSQEAARVFRESRREAMASAAQALAQAANRVDSRTAEQHRLQQALNVVNSARQQAYDTLSAAQKSDQQAGVTKLQADAAYASALSAKADAATQLAQIESMLASAEGNHDMASAEIARAQAVIDAEEVVLSDLLARQAHALQEVERLTRLLTAAARTLSEGDQALNQAQAEQAQASDTAALTEASLTAATQAHDEAMASLKGAQERLVAATRSLEDAEATLLVATEAMAQATQTLAPYLEEQVSLRSIRDVAQAVFDHAFSAVAIAEQEHQGGLALIEEAQSNAEVALTEYEMAIAALEAGLAEGADAETIRYLTLARDTAINTRNTTAAQLEQALANEVQLQVTAERLVGPREEARGILMREQAALDAAIARANGAQQVFDTATEALKSADTALALAQSELRDATAVHATTESAEAAAANTLVQKRQADDAAQLALTDANANLVQITAELQHASQAHAALSAEFNDAYVAHDDVSEQRKVAELTLGNEGGRLSQAQAAQVSAAQDIERLTAMQAQAEQEQIDADSQYVQATSELNVARQLVTDVGAALAAAQLQVTETDTEQATATHALSMAQYAAADAHADHSMAQAGYDTVAAAYHQAEQAETLAAENLADANAELAELNVALQTTTDSLENQAQTLEKQEAVLVSSVSEYGGISGYEAWKAQQQENYEVQFGDPVIEVKLSEIRLLKAQLSELGDQIRLQQQQVSERETKLQTSIALHQQALAEKQSAQTVAADKQALLAQAQAEHLEEQQALADKSSVWQQAVDALAQVQQHQRDAVNIYQQQQQKHVAAQQAHQYAAQAHDEAATALSDADNALGQAQQILVQTQQALAQAQQNKQDNEVALVDATGRLQLAQKSVAALTQSVTEAELAYASAQRAADAAGVALSGAKQQLESTEAATKTATTALKQAQQGLTLADATLATATAALSESTYSQALAQLAFDETSAALAPYLAEIAKQQELRDEAQASFDAAKQAWLAAHDAYLAAVDVVTQIQLRVDDTGARLQAAQLALDEATTAGRPEAEVHELSLYRDAMEDAHNLATSKLDAALHERDILEQDMLRLSLPKAAAEEELAAADTRLAQAQQDAKPAQDIYDAAHVVLKEANQKLAQAQGVRDQASVAQMQAVSSRDTQQKVFNEAEAALLGAKEALEHASQEHLQKNELAAHTADTLNDVKAALMEQKQLQTRAEQDIATANDALTTVMQTLTDTQQLIQAQTITVATRQAQFATGQAHLKQVQTQLTQTQQDEFAAAQEEVAAQVALTQASSELSASSAQQEEALSLRDAQADVVAKTQQQLDQAQAASDDALAVLMQASTGAAHTGDAKVQAEQALVTISALLDATNAELASRVALLAEREDELKVAVAPYGGLSAYESWKAAQAEDNTAPVGDPKIELLMAKISASRTLLGELSNDIERQQAQLLEQEVFLKQTQKAYLAAGIERAGRADALTSANGALAHAADVLRDSQATLAEREQIKQAASLALNQATLAQEQAQDTLTQASEALVAAQTDVVQRRVAADSAGQTLVDISAALEVTQAALAQAQIDVAEAAQESDTEKAKLDEAQVRLDALNVQVDELTNALKNAQATLNDADARLTQAQQEDMQAAKGAVQQAQTLERATSAKTAADTQLVKVNNDLAQAQQRKATAETALAQAQQAFSITESALAPYLEELAPLQQANDETLASWQAAAQAVRDADIEYQAAIASTENARGQAAAAEMTLANAQEALDKAIAGGEAAKWHELTLARNAAMNTRNTTAAQLADQVVQLNQKGEVAQRLHAPEVQALAAYQEAQAELNGAVARAADTRAEFEWAQATLTAALDEQTQATEILSGTTQTQVQATEQAQQAYAQYGEAVTADHDARELLTVAETELAIASTLQQDAAKQEATLSDLLSQTQQAQHLAQVDVNRYTTHYEAAQSALSDAQTRTAQMIAQRDAQNTAKVDAGEQVNQAIQAHQHAEEILDGARTVKAQATSALATATQQRSNAAQMLTDASVALEAASSEVGMATERHSSALATQLNAESAMTLAQNAEARALLTRNQARESVSTLEARLDDASDRMADALNTLTQQETQLEALLAPYGGMVGYEAWKLVQAGVNGAQFGDPEIEAVLAEISVIKQVLSDLSGNIADQQLTLDEQKVFLAQKLQEHADATAAQQHAGKAHTDAQLVLGNAAKVQQQHETMQASSAAANAAALAARNEAQQHLVYTSEQQQQHQQALMQAQTLAAQLATDMAQADTALAQADTALAQADTRYHQLLQAVNEATSTIDHHDAQLSAAFVDLSVAADKLELLTAARDTAAQAQVDATDAQLQASTALALAQQQLADSDDAVMLAQQQLTQAQTSAAQAQTDLSETDATLAAALTARATAEAEHHSATDALAPHLEVIAVAVQERDARRVDYDHTDDAYMAVVIAHEQAIVDSDAAVAEVDAANLHLTEVEAALAAATDAGDHSAIFELTVARNEAITAQQQARSGVDGAMNRRDELAQEVIRLSAPRSAAQEALNIAQSEVDNATALAAFSQKRFDTAAMTLAQAQQALSSATTAQQRASEALDAALVLQSGAQQAQDDTRKVQASKQQTFEQAETDLTTADISLAQTTAHYNSFPARIAAAESDRDRALSNIAVAEQGLNQALAGLSAMLSPQPKMASMMASPMMMRMAAGPVEDAQQALNEARAALSLAQQARDDQATTVERQRIEQQSAAILHDKLAALQHSNDVEQAQIEVQLTQSTAALAEASQQLSEAESDYAQKTAQLVEAQLQLADAQVAKLLAESAVDNTRGAYLAAQEETSTIAAARDRAQQNVDALSLRLQDALTSHQAVNASLSPKQQQLESLLIPYRDFGGYLSSKGDDIVAHAIAKHAENDQVIAEKEALIATLVKTTNELAEDISGQQERMDKLAQQWLGHKRTHEEKLQHLNGLEGSKEDYVSQQSGFIKDKNDAQERIDTATKDKSTAAINESNARIALNDALSAAAQAKQGLPAAKLAQQQAESAKNAIDARLVQIDIDLGVRAQESLSARNDVRALRGNANFTNGFRLLMNAAHYVDAAKMLAAYTRLSHISPNLSEIQSAQQTVQNSLPDFQARIEMHDKEVKHMLMVQKFASEETSVPSQGEVDAEVNRRNNAISAKHHLELVIAQLNDVGGQSPIPDFDNSSLKSELQQLRTKFDDEYKQLGLVLDHMLDNRYQDEENPGLYTQSQIDAVISARNTAIALDPFMGASISTLENYQNVRGNSAELESEKARLLQDKKGSDQALIDANNALTVAEQAIKDANVAVTQLEQALAAAFTALEKANDALNNAQTTLENATTSLNTVAALIADVEDLLVVAHKDEANARVPIIEARGKLDIAEVELATSLKDLNASNGHLSSARQDLADAYQLRGEVAQQLNLAREYYRDARDKVGEGQKAVGDAAAKIAQDLRMNAVSYDTDYSYDARGQLTQTLSAAVTYSERSETGEMQTRYGRMETVNDYDNLGNVVSITTAKGTQVEDQKTFEYTVTGQQTRSTGLAGSRVVYNSRDEAVVNYNAEGGRRDRVYDQAGQLRFEVDELGYVTEYRYNRFGEQVALLRYEYAFDLARKANTALELDALEGFILRGGDVRELAYSYDKKGQRTATVQASFVDAKAERVTDNVRYNAFGEAVLSSRTYQSGINPDNLSYSKVTVLSNNIYDASGRLLVSRDAENYVTVYDYNAFGERVSKKESSQRYGGSWKNDEVRAWLAGDKAVRTESYAYDNRGNQTQITRHDVTYAVHTGNTVAHVTGDLVSSMYYDLAGRVYFTVTEEGNAQYASHSDNPNAVINEYDALGRLVTSWGKERDYLVSSASLHSPSARKIVQPDRLSSRVQTDYGYDAHGNQVFIQNEDRITYQYYDPQGRLTGRRDAAGHYTAVAVDAMNRVIEERQQVSVSGELGYHYERVVQYKYDATGRQTETWHYGDQGRVRKEKAIYTAFGEVESKLQNGVVQERFSYNGLGQVTGAVKQGVSYAYEYDSLGHVAKETVGGERSTVRDYDNLGRLLTEQGAVFNQHWNGNAIYQPKTSIEYDRWGNAKKQTVNGVETYFKYDSNNNVIKQTGPATTIYSANGTAINHYYQVSSFFYDASGNHIGTKMANGGLHRSFYDAAGQKLKDVSASGAVKHYYHDARGDLIGVIGADGRGEQMRYNGNGQLESRARINLAKGYSEVAQRYYYDQAGQRYREDLYGATGYTSLTRYDRFGQIVENKGQGVHQRFAYDINGNRTREAWLDTQGDEQGVKTATFDGYSRMQTQTLINGLVLNFEYNSYNQLKRQHGEGHETLYSYYANGLLKSQAVSGEQTEQLRYDINGREIGRSLVSSDGSKVLNTSSTYDAAGRLSSLTTSEARWGEHSAGKATIHYGYDEVGNRRRIESMRTAPDGSQNSEVHWYNYDVDNRMTVSKGQLVGGSIRGGNDGSRVISYDIMGRRQQEFAWFNTKRDELEQVLVKQQTTLGYDGNGHLNSTVVREYNDPQASYHFGDSFVVSSMSRENTLTGHAQRQVSKTINYEYDSNGRLLGNTASTDTDTTQFAYIDSQMVRQQVNKNGEDRFDISFNYHFSGQVSAQATHYLKERRTDTNATRYIGWENYQREQTVASSTGIGWGRSTTTYHYNAVGALQRTSSSQSENERHVMTDRHGQIALSVEGEQLTAQLSVGGNQLGNLTADKLDADLLDDSAAEVGTQPGAYTVRQGDTLQTVSQKVYGDSRYWYLIADANAMGPEGELTPGKSLIIPNQHTQSYNGAESFKPYNESDILGDINPSPTAPPPPSKSCNPIAMIVMAVVAVVVAIYAPVLVGPMMNSALGTGMAATAATGAVAGASASAASQLVGKAFGVVDDFSWKQVGLGALAGGVMSGLSEASWMKGLAKAADTTSQVGRGMINASVSYATRYAGSKALGMDMSFSWTNLAASVAGGGVSSGLLANMPSNEVSNAFSSIAGASASSVLRGESFGENIGGFVADAFGNAIGSKLANSGLDSVNEVAQGVNDYLWDMLNPVDDSSILLASIAPSSSGTRYVSSDGAGEVDAQGRRMNYLGPRNLVSESEGVGSHRAGDAAAVEEESKYAYMTTEEIEAENRRFFGQRAMDELNLEVNTSFIERTDVMLNSPFDGVCTEDNIWGLPEHQMREVDYLVRNPLASGNQEIFAKMTEQQRQTYEIARDKYNATLEGPQLQSRNYEYEALQYEQAKMQDAFLNPDVRESSFHYKASQSTSDGLLYATSGWGATRVVIPVAGAISKNMALVNAGLITNELYNLSQTIDGDKLNEFFESSNRLSFGIGVENKKLDVDFKLYAGVVGTNQVGYAYKPPSAKRSYQGLDSNVAFHHRWDNFNSLFSGDIPTFHAIGEINSSSIEHMFSVRGIRMEGKLNLGTRIDYSNNHRLSGAVNYKVSSKIELFGFKPYFTLEGRK
ncbi:LysM peptidoglycan-binding domain-containing protein [Motilimonas cestriensis]|uniref:LysM peptidoglycan-binding domain-containing protein n=1 Tax=Motilimonas cestriensis TaxID=2742685 RepID=A0ABS8WH45_9GAMM|nr:LysM peptidoglycan-binding domain-containing protein [Motilimonas cestriensis]MCE2597048.1 LysM peptidoglycan-binding domain-containing protein [Motilimonas cestriensis]